MSVGHYNLTSAHTAGIVGDCVPPPAPLGVPCLAAPRAFRTPTTPASVLARFFAVRLRRLLQQQVVMCPRLFFQLVHMPLRGPSEVFFCPRGCQAYNHASLLVRQ